MNTINQNNNLLNNTRVATVSPKVVIEQGKKSLELPTLTTEQIGQNLDVLSQRISEITNNAVNLTYSVDKETGKHIIHFVDANTKEVIKQIPSEEMIRVTKSIDDFVALYNKQNTQQANRGLILNERV